MPEDFEEKLAELRKKQPTELTESDRAFLKARRSYLHAHEIASFGLEDEATDEQAGNDGEEEKPVSKSQSRRKAAQKEATDEQAE